MPENSRDEARKAAALAERIRPLLAGRGAGVQGAALANLLATWLAGHRIPGDPAAQQEMREGLLDMHIVTVLKLLPIADAEIDAKFAGEPLS